MNAERGFAVGMAVLIVAAGLRLTVLEDEAYYWTWSRQLASHYFDHPPLIAWLIRGAQAVLHNRFVALRAVSLTCLLVTFVATMATAGYLARPNSADARAMAGWMLAGSLLVSVALLPATPDAPLAALLSLAGYAFVRGFDGHDGWAAAAGALFGISVLAKLPAALVAWGVVLATVITVRGRARWRTPGPWAGAIFGLGVVAWWWASAPAGSTAPAAFFYQADRLSSAPSRWLTAVPTTVGGALAVVGPSAMLALSGATRSGTQSGTGPASGLIGGALVVLIACTAAVGLGSGELNWLLPVAIAGVPPAAAFAVAHPRVRLFRHVARAQAIVVAAVLVHVVVPIWPVPGAKDRTLRAAGWPAVIDAVRTAKANHRAQVVMTDSYQRASLIRFYVDDRWPVHERGALRPSQYDRWSRPAVCAGQTAVVVRAEPGLWPDVVPLADAQVVWRQRAGRTIRRVFVTPVRAVADIGVCSEARDE